MADTLAQLEAPPIFVVGHHRSGTTWVFDLLSARDDVAGVFESWLFTQEFGFGGLLHWGQWDAATVAERERVFGQRAGVGQFADRDEVVGACRDLATRWLARALEPHHRFLVEKSPDHLYATHAISDLFPQARFVNIVRDGRDVAVSVRAARSWVPGSLTKRATAVREVARRWHNALTVSERIAAHLGSRYHEVRYEELRSDPVRTVTALFAFCGIDPAEASVAAALDATDLARHQTSQEGFRRKGAVGDWARELSLLDRWSFHRVAGASLVSHGYAPSRWWWLRRPRTGTTRTS